MRRRAVKGMALEVAKKGTLPKWQRTLYGMLDRARKRDRTPLTRKNMTYLINELEFMRNRYDEVWEARKRMAIRVTQLDKATTAKAELEVLNEALLNDNIKYKTRVAEIEIRFGIGVRDTKPGGRGKRPQ